MKFSLKKPNSYFWIVFLPLHLLWILSFFLTSLNTAQFLTLTLIFWVLISGYGIGAGYHRHLSHKAFSTFYPIRIFISYLGCLGVQGSPIFWVNMHRGYHHPYSDTEKDVHSPIHGFLWSYLLWPIMVDYKQIQFRWVMDLLREPAQVKLHNYYFWLIWLTWIIAFFVSPIVFAALVWAQMITLHQEFCVNVFCHNRKLGYRNYETKDHSTNVFLFGLLFWGVGFHNNHHAVPHDLNFGKKWYELDLTRLLIWPIRRRA